MNTALEALRKQLHEAYTSLGELTATDHFSLTKVVLAHKKITVIIEAIEKNMEDLGTLNGESVKASLHKK